LFTKLNTSTSKGHRRGDIPYKTIHERRLDVIEVYNIYSSRRLREYG
jgi:hypothetical protein